jgi:hypothetical protein
MERSLTGWNRSVMSNTGSNQRPGLAIAMFPKG